MKHYFNFRKTGLLNIVIQAVILLAVFLFWRDVPFKPEPPLLGHLFAFGLALVPCLIWMVFFYLQDRKEPEPPPYLLFAFVLGAAMAALVWLPLKNHVFDLSSWLYSDLLSFVLGSVILYGGSLALVTFVLLKHVFQRMKEFDEPVDGMVYGAFAGTGYAFTESMDHLFQRPDFTLFPLVFAITANILIFSSSASLTGYYVGKIKFTGKGTGIRSVRGILVAMIAVGLYKTVIEIFMLEGLDHVYWYSFGAVILLSVILLLLALNRIKSLSEMKTTPKPVAFTKPGIPVLILTLIIIAAGLILHHSHTRDHTFSIPGKNIQFRYPQELDAGEVRATFSGTPVIYETNNRPVFVKVLKDTRITLHLPEDESELLEISFLHRLQGDELLAVAEENISEGGRMTTRLSYTFLHKSAGEKNGFPPVYRGRADLVRIGSDLLLFEVTAPVDRFESALKMYENILETIKPVEK